MGGGAVGLLATLLLNGATVVATSAWPRPIRCAASRRAKASGCATYDPRTEKGAADNTVDFVLDAVGAKATRNAALAAVRPGGVVVHVGLVDWASEIDMRKLTLAEITLIGTYTYTTADLNATVAALYRGAFGDFAWVEERRLADGASAFPDLDDGRTAAAKILSCRRMSDIVFESVSRVFARDGSDFPTLDDVSFDVREKEFVTIVGPSGCGKTTCLRMAAGLEFPDVGIVSVGGKTVTGPGPDRSVVFQQFALFPWKTVAQNIDFGLRSSGIAADERARRVARYIELMGLQGYESAFPHQLSGGMQQRVAIARSYVLDPDVLLMDEPFGALDAQTRTVMQEELIKLSRVNPRTVLFITHAVEEAVYLADRVVVMTRRPGRIGEIIDVGSVRRAERWDRHERIEDVMDEESFVHLRTRIWRLLREQQAPNEAH